MDNSTITAPRKKGQPPPIQRHPRIKDGYLYRGLGVGKGTALHTALENRNHPQANRLYEEQKAAFIKMYGEEFWNRLQ